MRIQSSNRTALRALLMSAAVAAAGLTPIGASARPSFAPSVVPHNLNSGVSANPSIPTHIPVPVQLPQSKLPKFGGVLGLKVPPLPKPPGPTNGPKLPPSWVNNKPPISLCAINPSLCGGQPTTPPQPVNNKPPLQNLCAINPSLCGNSPTTPPPSPVPQPPVPTPTPPQGNPGGNNPPGFGNLPPVVIIPPVDGPAPVVGDIGSDGPAVYQGRPWVRTYSAAPQSCFRKTNLPDGSIQLMDVCTNQQVMVPPGGNTCLAEQDAVAGSVWFQDACTQQQVLTPPAAAMEALQLVYQGVTKTSQN